MIFSSCLRNIISFNVSGIDVNLNTYPTANRLYTSLMLRDHFT